MLAVFQLDYFDWDMFMLTTYLCTLHEQNGETDFFSFATNNHKMKLIKESTQSS
jgi:hypothetical protein